MARRILLVDDDIAQIAAVKRVLQRAGHRAVLATNASDALAAAASAAPDLAIVARDCEGGAGEEVARSLAGADPAVPVLILGDALEGLDAAALSRPVDAVLLEQALARALAAADATPPRTPPAALAPPPPSEVPSILDITPPSQGGEEAALREAEEALRVKVAAMPADPAPAAPSTSTPTSSPPRTSSPPPTSAPTAPSAPTPPHALLSGDGTSISPPRLLALAAASRASGRLDVLLNPPRALWFEDGHIVGAASDAPGERPLDVALKLGLVTRAQHAVMEPATAGVGSRRVGVMLLEEGLLEASELAVLARARAQEIAAAILAGGSGHRFAPGATVPASERVITGSGTLAAVVEGVRHRWGAARVEAVLGGGDTLLAPGGDAPPLDQLGLSAEEARLASHADGLRTVDELLAEGGVEAGEGRALLAALVEIGALAVTRRAAPGASRARAAATDLARVEEKLRLVRTADYFTILGIDPGATAHAIGAAADQLLATLDLRRFPAASPELSADLQEIREVVLEARAVLSDDALRSSYGRAVGTQPPRARSGVANDRSDW